MTDVTSAGALSHRTRPPRAEYAVYFAVIFLAALPLATAAWGLDLIRGAERRGPIARAWSQARVIAPTIFSA